jgi:hypothetical protein
MRDDSCTSMCTYFNGAFNNIKQKIYQYYLQLVQDRIDVFRDMIAALTEDSKTMPKVLQGINTRQHYL